MAKPFKKKEKLTIKEPPVIEPIRKSLLDILNTNFNIFDRNIFVHRIFYIGEHHFEEPNELMITFHKIVSSINKGYTDESLSGLLLYYTNRFCHMIEASEFIIMKHLHLIFEDEQIKEHLGKVKMLFVVHHINQRFFDGWKGYYSQPPIRVENIDPESNLEATMRYIKNCIQKLYGLAHELEFTPDYDIDSSNIDIIQSSALMVNAPLVETTQRDPHMEYLPEIKLLDFLLNSKYLTDISKFFDLYFNIPQHDNYNDFGWPLPSDFIPYNIFDKIQDPIADLPNRGSVVEKPVVDIEVVEASEVTTPSTATED